MIFSEVFSVQSRSTVPAYPIKDSHRHHCLLTRTRSVQQMYDEIMATTHLVYPHLVYPHYVYYFDKVPHFVYSATDTVPHLVYFHFSTFGLLFIQNKKNFHTFIYIFTFMFCLLQDQSLFEIN